MAGFLLSGSWGIVSQRSLRVPTCLSRVEPCCPAHSVTTATHQWAEWLVLGLPSPFCVGRTPVVLSFPRSLFSGWSRASQLRGAW